MSALEADNGVGAFGQPVNNFAFAFVAPLCADYGYIRHKFLNIRGPFSAQKIFSAKGFAVRSRYDYGRTTSTLKRQWRQKMRKWILAGGAIALMATCAVAQRGQRLPAECRKEIVQLCGMNRDAIRGCLMEKARRAFRKLPQRPARANG